MNKKNERKLRVEDVEKIIANPYYCLRNWDMGAAIEGDIHEPLISIEQWVKANENLIKEIGADKWLYRLLQNLTGDYVMAPEE